MSCSVRGDVIAVRACVRAYIFQGPLYKTSSFESRYIFYPHYDVVIDTETILRDDDFYFFFFYLPGNLILHTTIGEPAGNWRVCLTDKSPRFNETLIALICLYVIYFIN